MIITNHYGVRFEILIANNPLKIRPRKVGKLNITPWKLLKLKIYFLINIFVGLVDVVWQLL